MSADNNNTEFQAFQMSALAGYPRGPAVLQTTSRRVRVPASINNLEVDEITIDTACDIPCISQRFMRQHQTLKNTVILPVPPGAINLRSADGSPLKLKGYARFDLTLGEITLPVEALVLPSLGPDKMLLDNSIMGAFGAVLDWQAEQLTFKTSKVKIPAQHRKTRLPTPTETDNMTCSVVALEHDTSDTSVPD